MDKTALLARLEQLDFFRYVAPEHLELVKGGLLHNIIEKRAFFFPCGENFQNLSGRLFSFDAESLTEAGALDLFNDVSPSLEKAGLKIRKVEQVFQDNPSSSSSRRPDYRFILNDDTCNLAKAPLIFPFLWGFVTTRYLKFLNRVLRKNKIKDRFYLMNDSASDTQLAFLTRAQVKFINSLKLDPNDKVYKPTFSNITFRPAMQIAGVIIKAMLKKKSTQN